MFTQTSLTENEVLEQAAYNRINVSSNSDAYRAKFMKTYFKLILTRQLFAYVMKSMKLASGS